MILVANGMCHDTTYCCHILPTVLLIQASVLSLMHPCFTVARSCGKRYGLVITSCVSPRALLTQAGVDSVQPFFSQIYPWYPLKNT